MSLSCALFAFLGVSDVASCQSVLDRPPNLSGGWLGARGTLQFNFVHRFGVGPAPFRDVSNSPTFLLSYRFPVPLTLGFNYATESDVADGFPNEWEGFARVAPLPEGRFPLAVALQLGYNQAAASIDAELHASRTLGPLRLMAVGRWLSNGYHADTARLAIGGGAVLRLHRWVSLAGDVSSLLEKRAGEEIAWGAGLQLAIPYSPHTLSLQVTNTNTGTVQGVSRGVDRVRGGFEFTIPITLSRYFGKRRGTAQDGAVGEVTGTVVPAEMRATAFAPSRIEVTAGTTIIWTNNDQLAHTVTADDGSWDSGLIEPGATWRRTFTQPGEFPFHCTPHPFMKGTVVVR